MPYSKSYFLGLISFICLFMMCSAFYQSSFKTLKRINKQFYTPHSFRIFSSKSSSTQKKSSNFNDDFSTFNIKFSDVELNEQSDMISKENLKKNSISENEKGFVSYNCKGKEYKFPIGEARDSRLSYNEGTESMELWFLGTASCYPSPNRNVNAIGFRYHGEIWLFDCGEGVQKLLSANGIKPTRVSKIFISHNHGDHIFGLPGLLCRLGAAVASSYDLQTIKPIEIYAPEGTLDYIRASMQLTYSKTTIPYVVHELKNIPFLLKSTNKPMTSNVYTKFNSVYGERTPHKQILPDQDNIYNLYSDDKIEVMAAPMRHTVPTVGFVIKEKSLPGKMKPSVIQEQIEKNKEALVALIPEIEGNYKKFYSYLKKMKPHETLTLPDNSIIRASDFLESPRPGRKIVIMGDTSSGDSIRNIAMDADVLVHESTNSYDVIGPQRISFSDFDRFVAARGHSTPRMAGQFAESIRAKQLILTHFSPRYPGDSSESSMKLMSSIEKLAREASGLTEPNSVITAWDNMMIGIPISSPNPK